MGHFVPLSGRRLPIFCKNSMDWGGAQLPSNAARLLCLFLLCMSNNYMLLLPSEAATQNFSVSFDSLSTNAVEYNDYGGSQEPLTVNLPKHGGMKAYIAYESQGIDFDPHAWLIFIPASPKASSFILAILVYSEFGDPAAVPPSDRIITWMANRHNPVSGNFSLFLDQTSGNLVLLDGNGSLAWSSNSTTKRAHGIVSMDLIADAYDYHPQPNGTLLLFDANNQTLWQSSDHPTHTLISGQYFRPGMSLISWASPSDPSEGLYSLVMEAGGLALYYNAFSSHQAYWIWSYYDLNNTVGVAHTCSNLTRAYMDPGGGLRLEQEDEVAARDLRRSDLCTAPSDGSHEVIFSSYGSGSLALTLLWLKDDGNLFVYTLGSSLISNLDLFGDNSCLLPNYCGPYGICTAPGNCECPGNGSFPSAFPSNRSQGCLPTRSLTCSQNQTAGMVDPSQISEEQQFLALSGVDHFSNKYSSSLNLSRQELCMQECLQNCSCLAAFWHVHSTSCFLVDHMSSLQGGLNNSYQAFLKVEGSTPPPQSKSSSSAPTRLLAGLVSGAVALVVMVCILAALICRKVRADKELEEEEPIWDSVVGFPTRYSYKDLHSITNGFSECIGKGGFGAVYAGILPDGHKVAVKRLESLRQGKEFRAEVVTLGGIHHYNLVCLVGFCAQGSHRLLVYEYMAKGSLDCWLFTTETLPLPWKHRFNIALGAARGLAYLHGECKRTIVHLDIKPQNILLDDNFVAKISDFGLSTLMGRDETRKITMMRGTPGYLAPEWLTEESTLSEKCDVFSFGKVLMEILGGRRYLDLSLPDTKQLYLPSWLYHQVVQEGREDELKQIARVDTAEEMRQAKLMMKAAFLCVLENPNQRPSMEIVVHLLEGHAPELEHLQLSDLLHGLQFALRMHFPSLAQTKIGKGDLEALPPSSQGGTMSFHNSAR